MLIIKYFFIHLSKKQLNMKDYIEKYILPYDTYENQLSYERGELEYDIDFVKEHMEHNELYKNN